jgi:DNA (cytosine-5)-methyltransferase 1
MVLLYGTWRNMKHLDLFSGIGGFALAARWAGIETVAFCEIDDFCRRVLQKNFAGIPIHKDIKTLNGEDYAGIDIITGGYPCQPFSSAGKRKGEDDPRHLWPEMRRIIEQSRPNWVICENVAGHITNGLDTVLDDMAKKGYETRQYVIPALAVGAPHRRDRVWIVAHSVSDGGVRILGERGQETGSDAKKRGQQDGELIQTDPPGAEGGWRNGWGSSPRICRVDDGIPDRVDRCKSLGNAIVPQIAYEIMRCIRAV